MTHQATVPTQINVTAFRFRSGKKGQQACPRTIEFGGNTYNFVDTGLSCTIESGGSLSRILMMSDGLRQFRLRNDERSSSWTLLSVG